LLTQPTNDICDLTMKTPLKSWCRASTLSARFILILSLVASVPAYALDVLDPDGTSYSGISDSSHFNESYTAANLFDYDMTGVVPGTFISFDTTEFARAGGGASFVAFQLDQVYTNIGSLFYAQRYATSDFVSQISIWTSKTTPFTAANSRTNSDSVVIVTNSEPLRAFWNEFVLTNVLSEQYFPSRLDRAAPSGNPGGRELRLCIFRRPYQAAVL
jgi:hypothetical protein